MSPTSLPAATPPAAGIRSGLPAAAALLLVLAMPVTISASIQGRERRTLTPSDSGHYVATG
jgi:hypothetical protein